MYKSPIEIIYGQMQTQMEGDIYRAVQSYGINVDKEELIRALMYDRDQYEKGFADGCPKWISVKDRLPGEGEVVLVYDKYSCLYLGRYLYAEMFNAVGRNFNTSAVAWMPLPPTPKGGDF